MFFWLCYPKMIKTLEVEKAVKKFQLILGYISV